MITAEHTTGRFADSRRITQFECPNLSEKFSLLFRRQFGDDFFEARIAAERRLRADHSKCRNEARKLFTFNTACGVYLARLHKKYPSRFESNHTRAGNRWTINPPEF